MKIGSFVVILLITLAIIVPSTGVHSQVVETESVIVQKEEQKPVTFEATAYCCEVLQGWDKPGRRQTIAVDQR